jgi:hypothetical protein
MKNNHTRFYKVECLKDEDYRIHGDMIHFAGRKNIGNVGGGFSALSFSDDNAVYFSYHPGQILVHPSVIEKTREELIAEFEKRLNESGLRWRTFDLGKLLTGVSFEAPSKGEN